MKIKTHAASTTTSSRGALEAGSAYVITRESQEAIQRTSCVAACVATAVARGDGTMVRISPRWHRPRTAHAHNTILLSATRPHPPSVCLIHLTSSTCAICSNMAHLWAMKVMSVNLGTHIKWPPLRYTHLHKPAKERDRCQSVLQQPTVEILFWTHSMAWILFFS